ncbi:hypothetical protein [Paenibacillus rhizolycopersici]|uniref:hypothetical protein n=1 Tax=Paenibacillus rhizolycopersici TaxID=2780073 RepID=UPI003D2A2084
MKVKIIKSDDEAWYKDHVGKVFAVEKKNGRNGIEYIVLPRDPHGDFYIDGGDCEEVED